MRPLLPPRQRVSADGDVAQARGQEDDGLENRAAGGEARRPGVDTAGDAAATASASPTTS